jgi:glucan 1,3-beta-glucosidase
MNHQGKAAFNTDQAYKVFRNVKEYGAKGDGHTDDTAAINKAISDGNRCEPLKCQSSTTTLAVVYFPSGKYLISSPLIDYYYTQVSRLDHQQDL